MAKIKEQEKRRQLRRKKMLLEKQSLDAQDVDGEIGDLETPDTSPDEPELVDKRFFTTDELVSSSGGGAMIPTSWEEIDDLHMQREKAEKVREAAWTVNDLVWNIINSPLGAEEKGAAISKVGSEFPKRIKAVMAEEKMEKELAPAQPDDLDLLEIEAMIAKDARHTPVVEKISNFISKATLDESKLPDDSFAVIRDVDGKKVREYLIHNRASVRASMSRAAKIAREGNLEAKEAFPAILSAAKAMEIGSVEKSDSAVLVEKDKNGRWRAVMWPTNNFKDLDGEIITEKAHLDYAEWVNANMDLAPVFVTWHLPETVRKSQIDFAGYQNGFLILSAPLEDDEAAGLFKAMKKCDVGMSHGSIVLKRNKENPKMIEKYLMVEASDLPLSNAANPFTDFAIITKEADMDMKAYLADLLGVEKADKILEKTGLKQAALREAGIQEKAQSVEPTPDTLAAPPVQASPELDQILKAVDEHLDLAGLSEFVEKAKDALERLPVLEAALKAAVKDNDEQLAEKIAPPIAKAFAWSRPSTSEENIPAKDSVEDQKLVKSKPEVHWLAELAGVDPLEV